MLQDAKTHTYMHKPWFAPTLTDACRHKHMYMNTLTFEDRTACPQSAKSALLQPILRFLVSRQPLVAILIITTLKEEVRRSSTKSCTGRRSVMVGWVK